MYLRMATLDDINEIRNIYAQYIDTSITFEYTLPSEVDFRNRIEKVLSFYPYIVCIDDDKIVSYAYATRFRERMAYQWSVETSVYIDKAQSGRGIGKATYLALMNLLKLQGVKVAYGCITCPNDASEKLHKSVGFTHIGKFTRAGYKNNNWHDIVWYENTLSTDDNIPAPLRPFQELPKDGIDIIFTNAFK